MAPKTYQTITVVIPLGGEVTFDVEGVKGKACVDITKSIQDALGGDVTSSKKKPEYFDKETEKAKLKTGV